MPRGNTACFTHEAFVLPYIRMSNYITLATKNLLCNRIRSALTLLGVTMGITAFVSVTSYSQNLKGQLQNIITNRFDLVVQAKGSTNPFLSRIRSADYEKLRAIVGIDDVPAVIIGAIEHERNPYLIVGGISSIEPLLSNIAVVEGRLFDLDKHEIILGERSLKRLNRVINEQIVLGGNGPFTIVGSYVTGSRILDNGVLMNMQDAKSVLKRGDDINICLVRITKGYRPDAVIKKIHENIPTLSVTKSSNFIGHIRIVEAADAFARAFSYIALIICIIVVSNTLLMSIRERTREIGILMAVGWSRFMIMKTILVEAVILCFLAGILGNLAGLFLLWGFSLSNITGLEWAIPAISKTLLLKSLGLSVGLGIASSLYPAILASRLSPADALRFE
jgi:putative ABC transport system permease protein